jgi:hypothetical protein
MKIKDINGRQRDCKSAYLDPNWPGFVTVEFVSKRRKGHKHTEWYPIDQFLQKNPDLEHLVKQGNSDNLADVVGVVTTASTKTLSDNQQKWPKNAYAGYMIWISRGKGEGQTNTILKNTPQTLTIAKKWTTIPDSTSQYVISKTLGNIKASGNKLPQVELQELEERARQMDLERGREPADKQYTN